jgi:adenylate kinase family enzyme
VRRIVVIGSGGAGKSTFARQLGTLTGLPVIHLDRHYWRAGWTPTPREEWQREVEKLAAGDEWIIDGNYSGSMDVRLRAADTVIFLDLPRVLCLWRVIRRRVRFRGMTRPDVGSGCPERLTGEFIRWIWTYPRLVRPKVLARLRSLPVGIRVITLESRRSIESFLQGTRSAAAQPLA